MQREDIRKRLRLAAMQVWRMKVNAEQRGRVDPVCSKRNRSGGVVADLYRIGGIECPYLFEIIEGEAAAGASTGERLELVRCGAHARIDWSAILSDGARVGAVKDLTLCPLRSTMAGGAKLIKDRPPARKRLRVGRTSGRLGLVQRAHSGENPQCLRIEGVAPSLCDAVVIDGRVGDCVQPGWHVIDLVETIPGVEVIAGETTP